MTFITGVHFGAVLYYALLLPNNQEESFMTQNPSSKQPPSVVIKRILLLLLISLFVLFAYTFIHEGGHALMGLLFGGKITSFSVNFWDISAHVALHGEFTNHQRILISAAGISLPLLVLFVLLIFTPRLVNPVLNWLRIAAAMVTLNPLLAWIVIPFLYMSGNAPRDDSTNFLNLTGFPPLLVSAGAAAVYAAGFALFFRSAGSPRQIYKSFRNIHADMFSPAARRSMGVILAVAMVFLSITLALQWNFEQQSLSGTQPDVPAGYSLVSVLQFDDAARPGSFNYPFTLDQPAAARFFFVLEDIRSGPVEIILHGSQSYESVVLRTGESDRMGRATVRSSDEMLDPGAYSLDVSFRPGPGKITIYQSGLE
jgi:hypothetical protein